jgi:16S rRNA processing protein RimM
MSDLFPVGKIVGFHGLAGEVKVNAQGNAELVGDIETVTAKHDKKPPLTLQVRNLRAKGNQLLLSFTNYPDRTSVEPLLDYLLLVDRKELRDLTDDEWWLSDLIGLPVYTTEGRSIGTISSVIDGPTPTLEIKDKEQDETKSILIPFVKDLVPKVDIKDKRIEVVDLPGLLEFQ